MTRLTRLALVLPFAALFALPQMARAQCAEGDIFCASASISIGGGQPAPPPVPNARVIVTTRPAPPVANQQVIITTQPAPPPRVIIQAAPPPPPPPPVVVIRAAPPPPPRTVIVVRTNQPPPQQVIVEPLLISTEQRIGVHGHIGAMVGPDVQMGGFTGALRLRPTPHLAFDLGLGVYAGQDYNGRDRIEVPVTVDALFFVNPLHRMQFYLLAGVGVSRARTQGFGGFGGGYSSRSYTHIGGELGLGLEWRLNPHFALTSDIRTFLRTRVDSNPEPEFVNSSGETTNVSTGALLTFGGTIYF
ncbi:MAG: porin family protein [Deltaproteobacteria bacterium]|nr:porin family protein [Deltaproteobacteria bacterium]